MAEPVMRRVLTLISDQALLGDVERVVASCGVPTATATLADVATAGAEEPVLVDAVAAARLSARGVRPRRLAFVTADEPDAATWRAALSAGADVVLVLPGEERALVTWLMDAHPVDHAGELVCCLAGRGGAGASTLAAALALAVGAAAGSAMLLDLDPASGGQDLLLGVERKPGARWSDLGEKAPPDGLLSGAPSVAGVAVVSADARAPDRLDGTAVDRVVTAAIASHPAVVADVSRSAAGSRVVGRARAALVVATADVRGVAAARRVVAAARLHACDVRVVVRRPSPGDLRPRDVADAVEAPLAAVWPWDRRLGALVDAGAFAARWSRTSAGSVAQELAVDLFGCQAR